MLATSMVLTDVLALALFVTIVCYVYSMSDLHTTEEINPRHGNRSSSRNILVDYTQNEPSRSHLQISDATSNRSLLGPRSVSFGKPRTAKGAAFILADNADNDSSPVLFTQKDVRETQLAKAAIRAGIVFLQKKIGVTDDQIDQILLAGAFGNYIDRKSAVRIGLLPAVGLDKVHFVGNAAATGSQMVLINNDCRKRAGELVKNIEYVEIANEMEFQMVFADALMFD